MNTHLTMLMFVFASIVWQEANMDHTVVQFTPLETIIQPISWLHYSVTIDLSEILSHTPRLKRRVLSALSKAGETSHLLGKVRYQELHDLVDNDLSLLEKVNNDLFRLLHHNARTVHRRSFWDLINSIISVGGTLFNHDQVKTVARETRENRRYIIANTNMLNKMHDALEYWFQAEVELTNNARELNMMRRPILEAINLIRATTEGLSLLMSNKISTSLMPVDDIIKIWSAVQKEIKEAKYFMATTDSASTTLLTMPISHIVTNSRAIILVHIPIMPQGDTPKVLYGARKVAASNALAQSSVDSTQYIAVNVHQTRFITLSIEDLFQCTRVMGTKMCPLLQREYKQPNDCLSLLYFRRPEAARVCRYHWRVSNDTIQPTDVLNTYLVQAEGSILSCPDGDSQIAQKGMVEVKPGCNLQTDTEIVHHLRELNATHVIHRHLDTLPQLNTSTITAFKREELQHLRQLLGAKAEVPTQLLDRSLTLGEVLAITAATTLVLLCIIGAICFWFLRRAKLTSVLARNLEDRLVGVEHRQHHHEELELAEHRYGRQALEDTMRELNEAAIKDVRPQSRGSSHREEEELFLSTQPVATGRPGTVLDPEKVKRAFQLSSPGEKYSN